MTEEQLRDNEWWTNLCHEITALVFKERDKLIEKSHLMTKGPPYEDYQEDEYEIEMKLFSLRPNGPAFAGREALEAWRRGRMKAREVKDV